MADDNFTSQLYLLLVVFGSGALIIVLYYFLRVACSDVGHRAGRRHRPPISTTFISRRGEPPSSTENSMADLIPARKYQKRAGSLVGEDGGINTCAVCLCDFEEGEELRTLPECMHSFHVLCIDMWLYSHSTCPICRTHAITSLSQVLQRLSDNHSPTLPPPAFHHGSTVIPDLGG